MDLKFKQSNNKKCDRNVVNQINKSLWKVVDYLNDSIVTESSQFWTIAFFKTPLIWKKRELWGIWQEAPPLIGLYNQFVLDSPGTCLKYFTLDPSSLGSSFCFVWGDGWSPVSFSALSAVVGTLARWEKIGVNQCFVCKKQTTNATVFLVYPFIGERIPLKCKLGSQLCSDGLECVLFQHLCDGESDCRDGSDEENCQTVCNEGTKQVKRSAWCNWIVHFKHWV